MRRQKQGTRVSAQNNVSVRSVLGNYRFARATITIAELKDRCVMHTVDFPLTAEQLIKGMFPAQVIEDARRGYAVVPANSTYQSRMVSYDLGAAALSLSEGAWDKLHMLAPAPKFCYPLDQYPPEVLTFLQAVEKIETEFAVVQSVLEWMDQYATLGAMREYWPTILSLLPGHCDDITALKKGREPQRLGEMLHLIRASASTVASALWLPKEAPPVEQKGLHFYFEARALPVMSQMIGLPKWHLYI